MHAKVFGKVKVAHDIGDHAQSGPSDHYRHDRQPVQAIGQVYGVGGTHNHKHPKGHVEPAQIDQRVLENGQCQLAR